MLKFFGGGFLNKAVRPKIFVLWGLAILINLLWALAYPLSKQTLVNFPPFGLAVWRMFFGALVLLPFVRRRELPERLLFKDALLLIAMGVIGCGAATLLQFVATTLTFSSHISLIVAVETFLVMLLARGFLNEAITKYAWGGSVIAFLGVGLISFEASSLGVLSKDVLLGNLLMLLSVACYALYTIIGKVLSVRWGASALTALPFLVAVVVLGPAFYVWSPEQFVRACHPDMQEWKMILFIGVIGAGAGYWVWNWLLKFLPAGELSRSLYFQPIAGILFSALLLSEKIEAKMIIGSVLVLVGVALSELKVRRDSAYHESPKT